MRVCFFEMIGIQEVSYFYYEVRILVHLQDKGRIFLGQILLKLEKKHQVKLKDYMLFFYKTTDSKPAESKHMESSWKSS